MQQALTLIIRSLAVAALSCTLVSIGVAQKLDRKVMRQHPQGAVPHHTIKPHPVARSRPAGCAEFGPGFVRMPGSDSCIRFGGGVGLGVGAVP